MSLKDETSEGLLKRLAQGNSMVTVCQADDMPGTSSVYAWIEEDAKFAGQVLRAREIGYQLRADLAITEA